MSALTAALWLAAVPADDIARAHEQIAALECDEALALGRAIAADPAADETEAREGRLIAGYCLAAAGRVSEAEEQFRAAVAEDVRVEAGFAMEHRVQYLLDAARAEVLAERARRAATRRAALAAQVELVVEPPRAITGGERASFVVHVTGPAAARVTSLKLQFRRPTDPEYYSLPVRRGSDGAWRGEIGGIYTGSARAYTLQWFISASDEEGELTSAGSRVAPHRLAVAAGSRVAADLHARERLPPITRLLIAGVGAPASVVAAAVFNLVATSVVASIRVGIVDDVSFPALLTWAAVPVTMAAAEAATTFFLLEGDVAFWPAVAVGGTGLVVDLIALLAFLNPEVGGDVVPNPSIGLEGWLDTDQAFALELAVLATAAVGSAVPFSMILWETGQYVE